MFALLLQGALQYLERRKKKKAAKKGKMERNSYMSEMELIR